MYKRMLNISKNNSFFLFGPRGTGKSTLIRESISVESRYDLDLLDASNARLFLSNPSRLRQIVEALPKEKTWVFIDEVQKIPEILDVVHLLIEKLPIRFALTGSSARKLKRGGANLLAGRAFVYNLFPLTSFELGAEFDLATILLWGGLPKLFALAEVDDKAHYLEAYVHTYLREEILEEQLVRKVEPFNQFLQVVAQCNGEIVNYSKIAEDTGSNYNSIKAYFEILEDTLIGFRLSHYSGSIRKRQGSKPKFYLFDNGIKRTLDNSLRAEIPIWGNEYGRLFESFIIGEIFRLNSYLNRSYKFSYLRVGENLEIDLVIETPNKETLLVEIKSSANINQRHLSSLKHFFEDFPNCKMFCLSQDPTIRIEDGVNILPWQEGLRRIMRV